MSWKEIQKLEQEIRRAGTQIKDFNKFCASVSFKIVF